MTRTISSKILTLYPAIPLGLGSGWRACKLAGTTNGDECQDGELS